MNKTGYKGIKKNKVSWSAYLTINGKNTYLGSFKDMADAIFCHNAAERLYYPKRKQKMYTRSLISFSGNIGGL